MNDNKIYFICFCVKDASEFFLNINAEILLKIIFRIIKIKLFKVEI